MVFAAAGAVARTTIQVGARIGAITRFLQLSAAIGGSQNSLVKFGRTALIAGGQASILGAALNVLKNPLTGIAALLETGLATAQWISFSRGVRSARVQIRLMGLDTKETEDRLKEMRTGLGLLGARDLFNAGRAVVGFNKLTKEWRDQLTLMKPAIEASGVDFEIFAGKVGEAFSTGKISDIEAMATTFGDIETKGKTFLEVMEEIVAAMEGVSQADLTNIEQTVAILGDIQERASGIIGPIVDALNVVPLLAAKVTKAAIFAMLDIIGDFATGIATIAIGIKDTAITLGDVFLLALEGKFEEIPSRFVTLWNDKIWPAMRNDIAPLMVIAGTVIGGMIAGPIGVALGATVGKLIGEGIIDAVEGDDFTKLAGTAGGIIGFKLAGPMGVIIGASLGILFAQFSQEAGNRDATTMYLAAAALGAALGFKIGGAMGAAIGVSLGVTIAAIADGVQTGDPNYLAIAASAAALGASIGFLIGGPVGAGIGAAVGAILGILTTFVTDNWDRFVEIGKDIGNALWEGIKAGLGFIGEFFTKSFIGSGSPFLDDFAHGGVVKGPIGRPQLAVVHGGETIIPAGRGTGTIVIPIYIGDRKVDEVVADSFGRLLRQGNIPGRRLGSA